MRRVSPASDLSAFWESLEHTDTRLLLLDYDGTLAPFRIRRDEAVPYPGVREILDEIIATSRSRVVIISGRTTKNLIPLLALEALPEIWGSHGRERLFPTGDYSLLPISPQAERHLEEACRLAEEAGLGDRLEVKPGCLAVHLRGLSQQVAIDTENAARRIFNPFERTRELSLHVFDGGVELRAHGFDKGRVVETILGESGPGCVAAYLGDDRTDEDAFLAIKGRGLGVLVRTEWRETAADIWIRPPEDLIDFLRSWKRKS